jgi:hypothetical protein
MVVLAAVDQEHPMDAPMVVLVMEDIIRTVTTVEMEHPEQEEVEEEVDLVYQTYLLIILEHTMEHLDHPQVLVKRERKADLEL